MNERLEGSRTNQMGPRGISFEGRENINRSLSAIADSTNI